MEEKYSISLVNKELPPQFRQTVSAIIDTLINPECLKWDLFIALLLIIMKENNFHLLKTTEGNAISVEDYILNRKTIRSTIRETVFVLDGFQSMPFKVIICPLNDLALIIATIPDMHIETYTHCVKINRYINISTLGIPSDYINLKELITILGDRIVNPIKGSILNYHKYPSPNLFGLPDDIVHKILLYLAVKDVLYVGETCKKLYRIVKEDRLWYRICNRDFPGENKDEADSWFDVYIKLYVSERNEIWKNRYYGTSGYRECSHISDYMRRISNSRWEVIL
ncbi:unnamed protein product [Diatraea saccharalis]|uniref:F-box domain-containing protein n=1 Tax=Diatraea saccharalis TaxID=40085 RepID=A0A9N9RFB2_9NEOP|nr:unnamed protein product [Diatraea saccharalis]